MARKKIRNKTRRQARKTVQARKKVPLGVLIWTALILLVGVVFLFNRGAIGDVMQRTELVAVLQRSVDNVMRHSQPAAGAPAPPEVTGGPVPPAVPDAAAPQPDAPRDAATPRVVAGAPAPRSDAPPPAAAQPAVASPAAAPPPPAATVQPEASPPARARDAKQRRLFFAAVSDAGGIAVTAVTRAVEDTAAPLTATLKTLLAGPDARELNQGLITLIPPAVTLNRVYVSERVAYIDVSETFRFNSLGREGLDAQLQQIVFSATEFPGVETVQILIDGHRVDFLGPEGTYIGRPIGRATFLSDPPPAP